MDSRINIEQREGKWWAERDGEWVKCHELPDGTFQLPFRVEGEVQNFFVGMKLPEEA